jgi:hypothetical protein
LLGLAERDMESLAARRDQLVAEMAATTTDYVALGQLGTQLHEVQERLAEVEERWLELSEELGA